MDLVPKESLDLTMSEFSAQMRGRNTFPMLRAALERTERSSMPILLVLQLYSMVENAASDFLMM